MNSQDADRLQFSMIWPPGITFGAGTSSSIGEKVRARGGRRVLLVTDPGLVQAGLAERIASHLRSAGLHAHIFAEVKPNPTLREVEQGVALFRRDHFDFLIALGGGSSIDASKVMSMQLLSGRSIEEIEANGVDDVPGKAVGFIAIPSTSGTGSEATTGALVKDASGKKYLVRSVRCRPQEALLDPELTLSVPARMTASTGMDAFIHALGSYTNTMVNPMADVCAKEAIRLVAGNLLRAIENGQDIAARANMMLASHLAGVAISLKGNDAIHGLSTAVESVVDCTHGESLSALMPHVLRFNREAARERYAAIADLLGVRAPDPQSAAQAAVDGMIALRDAAGTCRRLAEVGVQSDMLDRLTAMAAKGRSTQINIRRPSEAEIRQIYEAAL